VSAFPVRLALTGSLFLAGCVALALTQARLGSRLFFAIAAALAVSHLAVLWLTRNAPPNRRLLIVALGFAVAGRLPLAVGPVNFDSDMIRYIWDGRAQRFGVNPYSVIPADPSVAHTHTVDTVRMPSRNVRTPYPPAAQLFFRALVTLRESPRVMKLALLVCDLLTIFFVLRWLRLSGRSEWLTLAYAWNPLVILEIAHSGHIDALATMWIAASAYWLARKRTALASVAFTLAVATKLVPIVLAPLFLGRVRPRDIGLGVALMAALYLPFSTGAAVPVGAVPSVVEHIRFNSPIFRPLAWVITPAGAAAFALAVGLGAALWARLKLDATDPAAWAWPMALALACAPVVYPWYLLCFTPFLFTRAALPLMVWTYTVIPVYIVWERALSGGRWRVPTGLLILEYGLVIGTAALVVAGARTAASRLSQPARAREAI
jgi:alpha-1,6-mannosyltransferase